MNFIQEMRDLIKASKADASVLDSIGDRIEQNLKAIDVLEGGNENELLATVFKRIMTRLTKNTIIKTDDFELRFTERGLTVNSKNEEVSLPWSKITQIKTDIFNGENLIHNAVHPLIINEIRAGNNIKAIKYFREAFGGIENMPLKEAKYCIDTLAAQPDKEWTYHELFSKTPDCRRFLEMQPSSPTKI
jgi:hypothetical protein